MEAFFFVLDDWENSRCNKREYSFVSIATGELLSREHGSQNDK
jgi:hypothetical protein